MIPSAFAGVDASVKVGGENAGGIDFFDLTRFYTPLAIAFVRALFFLLLMVVFRSVVLPALGVALNLLSPRAPPRPSPSASRNRFARFKDSSHR